MIQVEHNRWNVTNVVGRGVAEDEHLNDWRPKEQEASPLIAEHLDELLDQHLFQAG
jgi:hypothetical protein